MNTRTKRKRRQAKQALKHGAAAKPRHRLKGGRTGQVQARKNKARRKP